MKNRKIGAAEIRAKSLAIIQTMSTDGQPVVVTKRGKPVALLSPLSETPKTSIIGALKGSVWSYVDPFEPAVDSDDWTALT